MFFTEAAVHRCVWQIKYWFHLQGAHGQFRLAQERDSGWLMPTVRMTWGRIIYSPGAKRFDAKLNHLPDFLITASFNVSVFFNRSNGYESSKGCRSKKLFSCFVFERFKSCIVIQLQPWLAFKLYIMALYDLYVPNQDSLCLFNKIIRTPYMMPRWFISPIPYALKEV